MPQQQVIDVTPVSTPANAVGIAQIDIAYTKSTNDQGVSGEQRFLRSILSNAAILYENTFSVVNGDGETTVTLPPGITTLVIFGPLGNTGRIQINFNDAEQLTFHGQAPLVYPLPNDTWIANQTIYLYNDSGTTNPITIIGF